MYEFVTHTMIQSTPEKVWGVLTNVSLYGEWNPEIVAIDGRMALGERLKARVRVGSGAIRPVSLRVTAFEVPSLMEWTGGLPFGLFTGKRRLTLIPGEGVVEFRMVVQMSGLLASSMVKAVGDRQTEIDRFSAALKARSEQMAAKT